MGNPFSTAAPVTLAEPITPRQRDFLRDLMRQKAEIQGLDLDVAMPAAEQWMDNLSKSAASEQIDKTLAAIKELRTAIPGTSEPASEDSIEGFWELPDGRICKVQIAVHGSGKPYAKVLDTVSGGFDYAPGLVNEVRRNGTRLTLDRAKELGHLYGMCIRCGATLTDESSIEAGIGPICASKF